MHSELRDEPRQHPNERNVGEVSGVDELVKAVGPSRGPGANDVDGEVAAGRLEGDAERVRRSSRLLRRSTSR